MSNEVKIAFLEQRVAGMEQQFILAKRTIANHARNALVALDEDDTDTVREILNALAGNE